MFRYLGIAGCLLIMVFMLQASASAGSSDVVAKIGNKNITVSDFERMVGYFDPDRLKMLDKNPQMRESVLRQFVQSIVISQLAKEKGFDKKPEVKEQVEFFKDNLLANLYLKQEVAGKIQVPEEDMKTYYQTHKDEFKVPEMVRARHILVKIDPSASEKDKKAARKKAEDILKKIKAGEDFAKLATEVSDDPGSKQKGGDLGFFPRGRMIKPFEDAAFSLKPGQVSGLVETQYGYHIIKAEEKKDATQEPFDAVKERINQKLFQDQAKSKVAEFIEKAMKDAKVELKPEVLSGEKK